MVDSAVLEVIESAVVEVVESDVVEVVDSAVLEVVESAVLEVVESVPGAGRIGRCREGRHQSGPMRRASQGARGGWSRAQVQLHRHIAPLIITL